jgi:hypothetical protein
MADYPTKISSLAGNRPRLRLASGVVLVRLLGSYEFISTAVTPTVAVLHGFPVVPPNELRGTVIDCGSPEEQCRSCEGR